MTVPVQADLAYGAGMANAPLTRSSSAPLT